MIRRFLLSLLICLSTIVAAHAGYLINPYVYGAGGGGGGTLTITSLDSATSVTSTATLATGANITASVGDMLVAVVAADNNGTSGANSLTSVQDSSSNTWTQQALILYDPGAAAAGATLGVYTAPVTSAPTGGTFTANFSPNTTAKALRVYRVQSSTGGVQVINAYTLSDAGSTGTTTTHSAPTVSVTDGDTIFGFGAIESNTTMTADSDTTNGTWSASGTRTLASGAGDATSMAAMHQFKTVNATGNQDWAQTTAGSEDSARSYLVLRPQ